MNPKIFIVGTSGTTYARQSRVTRDLYTRDLNEECIRE
jgi:hypothetical protein